jgi:hypothetical protein
MWRGVAVGVGLAAVVAGCSVGSHSASSGNAETALPTRTCGTGVSGALPRGWRSSSLRAGSVWLYLWGAVQDDGHRGVLSPSRFAAVSSGQFHPWKMMVIVPAGHSVLCGWLPRAFRGCVWPLSCLSKTPVLCAWDKPPFGSSRARKARPTTTAGSLRQALSAASFKWPGRRQSP